MAREKTVGWRKEPVRHGLAAKGIKTNVPHAYERPRGLSSMVGIPQRKPVSFSEHNWGFEDDGKNLKVRLGNWSDAGWHWDGDEDEMVGFLVRMAGSDVRREFLEKMKAEGVDFKAYRHILLAAARDGDGLYQASGDNRLWHFGDMEPDEEMLEENAREIAENWGWPQEKIDAYIEGQEYWTYSNPDNDYDTYASEMGDAWARAIKDTIEMSDSWEDFMDEVGSEDFKYDWAFESETGGYDFVERSYYDAVPDAMRAWEKQWEGS